ncbi:FAD:protein FMN transferase [Candidatus Saccharibacteria bacterium]|nr:FAD:protein FMN transferase [Candidatus Saccharibacteria bacterium]
MKQTRLVMGMPATLEIVAADVDQAMFDSIFDYFKRVDEKYSTYKDTSEISRINQGLSRQKCSLEMKTVLDLCEQTKAATNGYFDVDKDGQLDPSGLVKGWAINNAAKKLRRRGFKNFYVDIGGDIQVGGHNAEGQAWTIGLRNPFNRTEIVKRLNVSSQGVATSGTYIRGQHIYNPRSDYKSANEVVALTVIGPNIYDADRFATGAFAMGKRGINFIESLVGYEGYTIDHAKMATMTSGFEKYVIS